MTYDLHIIKRFLMGYLLLTGGLIIFFVVRSEREYMLSGHRSFHFVKYTYFQNR